jgi:hypothetical protein
MFWKIHKRKDGHHEDCRAFYKKQVGRILVLTRGRQSFWQKMVGIRGKVVIRESTGGVHHGDTEVVEERREGRMLSRVSGSR